MIDYVQGSQGPPPVYKGVLFFLASRTVPAFTAETASQPPNVAAKDPRHEPDAHGDAIAVMVVCQRVSKAALARCTHASPARAYQYIGIKTLLRHETVMVK